MKNPGSNYVQRNTNAPHKPHNIKHEQINELFRAVGWIGRRRPVLFLKAVPELERTRCSAGKE